MRFELLDQDPTTRAYSERRKKEGLSHRGIMRCLKRYLARELYVHVRAALSVRPLPDRPLQHC